jgi:diketogulonate reductase-like aldo/keto reductase
MMRDIMSTSRRSFLKGSAAVLASLASPGIQRAFAEDQKESMLTRKMPSTGEAIPVIGLGTSDAFNPPDMTDKTLAPLQEVLRIFYDAGGRLIDTAPSYGRAEHVTGELAHRMKINTDLFLATKISAHDEKGATDQMELSLARLRRKKLDLEQIHSLVDWQNHLKLLRRWKDEDRVRYIGVTHYTNDSHAELEQIVKSEKIDFVQLNYSVASRGAEKSLLPAAKDKGVAVLVNRTFEDGALFRHVQGKPLPDFVKEFASSWGEAFLKFCLANDAVTCVIPATSKPYHMVDNVKAGFGKLPSPEQCDKLAEFVK